MLGRRMAVEADSEIELARYTFVPSSDTPRSQREVWRHHGLASGGSAFSWAQGLAHYLRDEDGLPGARVTVLVYGDSPMDRPLEGQVEIPVK